ncbi:MAG: 2-succinyl-5-enolpyruvyl-6-hydroxy-3-cyclohexene-1-carboxylate synthase, partial [Flavobacteriales bacterium]|nr:2-succinyl-5-enolpyruvyl-6-hydroxy-3-cyclohexene-1-carboxylate synthase [Flavobacteriales bacterium]
IANSSSIRYSQLFNFKAGVTYWCNRGTSGIDGSTSTAVGAAVVCDRPVTHITGDLSFFYDSNALWNNYIPSTMRIIVMNNGGGGIFRILDGSRKADCCADFLEARHSLSAVHIAKMYDIDYVKVDDDKTLREALDGFWKDSPRPRMIEVFTPRDDNDTILRDYFKFLIKDKE